MPISSEFPDVFIADRPVHEILLDGIKQHILFGRNALINGETNAKFTFRDVYNLTYLIASHLHKDGLRKGDTVVICMPNRPEYALIFLATALRGGITSGVNSAYTKEELATQFKDSRCKFIFTTGNVFPKVQQAANGLSHVQKIYVLGQTSKNNTDPLVGDFESLCEVTNPNWRPMDVPGVKFYTKTDVAYLPYSSGTTGVPKGTMLSHYNIAAIMNMADNPAFFLRPSEGDVILGLLPFFHIFGFFVLLISLKNGQTVVTMPHFDPHQFLESIQYYKMKTLYLVPPILVFLAKHPMVSEFDVSSVEMVAVGAAPVGKDISEALVERHPNIKFICQGYGMTEVTAVSHIMPPISVSELKHGSCGLLLPNYQCKVINTESGEELEANQRGEICLKSVTIMLGYLNRPDATEETIDSDGWLHTGDIGYYDEDRFFYIVDRLKELIKVKGFQVPPAELEDLLLSHDGIQDAAVIGIEDPLSGEIPRAFLVRNQGSTITEEEVQKFVQGKVAPYKHLTGGVEFVSELPKSPSGKILRRILREQMLMKKQNSKI